MTYNLNFEDKELQNIFKIELDKIKKETIKMNNENQQRNKLPPPNAYAHGSGFTDEPSRLVSNRL